MFYADVEVVFFWEYPAVPGDIVEAEKDVTDACFFKIGVKVGGGLRAFVVDTETMGEGVFSETGFFGDDAVDAICADE